MTVNDAVVTRLLQQLAGGPDPAGCDVRTYLNRLDNQQTTRLALPFAYGDMVPVAEILPVVGAVMDPKPRNPFIRVLREIPDRPLLMYRPPGAGHTAQLYVAAAVETGYIGELAAWVGKMRRRCYIINGERAAEYGTLFACKLTCYLKDE